MNQFSHKLKTTDKTYVLTDILKNDIQEGIKAGIYSDKVHGLVTILNKLFSTNVTTEDYLDQINEIVTLSLYMAYPSNCQGFDYRAVFNKHPSLRSFYTGIGKFNGYTPIQYPYLQRGKYKTETILIGNRQNFVRIITAIYSIGKHRD